MHESDAAFTHLPTTWRRNCHPFGQRSQILTSSKDTDEELDKESMPLALPGAGGSSFDSSESVNRFAPVAKGKDLDQTALVSDKFELRYTCKLCGARNSNKVSRLAYTKGVVISVCTGCSAKHVLSDNLGWHIGFDTYDGETDIEKFLASKGRESDVSRVSQDVFELERLMDESDADPLNDKADGKDTA